MDVDNVSIVEISQRNLKMRYIRIKTAHKYVLVMAQMKFILQFIGFSEYILY